MGQAKTRLVAGLVDLDEAGAPGGLEADIVDHPIGQPHRDRLSARDLLDHRPAPLVGGEQARLHELGQPVGRLQCSVPAPDVATPDEGSVDLGGVQHLADEQRCATRDLPDPPARYGVDLAAEHRMEHGRDHRPVQRADLLALE
ncbi:MAG: hypothetical protein ACRD0V_19010 [Acidimicrobiales bacterium]